MDGTEKNDDKEPVVLVDSKNRIFVYYVEFWEAIEESQITGHDKLRKFLDERKVHIGDSIPNKDFWLQIKGNCLNEQQTKSNELTDKPPSYKTLVSKDEPGKYTKMVELNLKNEKNDKSDGSTEELDDNEADIEVEGIFRKTYTTGSVKYCEKKMRLVHRYRKKGSNQKDNETIGNKDETDLMKSFNKKQVNEMIEESDEADGYIRLKEESSSLNKFTPHKDELEKYQVPEDELEKYQVPEGHLYRLGKKIEGVQNDTVFRIILDNVFNGHELILHVLDTLVSKTSVNECSDCFGYSKKDRIKVDLGPLFKRKTKGQECLKNCRNKMRFIHDLIEIENERGDDENIKKIFKHPVLEILILKKWEEKQHWYFHSVRQFVLFVLLFTFFVRMKILQSITPKLEESLVDVDMPNMFDGKNITFTPTMINQLDFNIGEQVVDGSKKGMKILDRYFIYKITNIHDNGTFTAKVTQVPSFYKVFYNKEANVILFVLIISCLIISQISFVFIYFIEQFTIKSEEMHVAPKLSDTGRQTSVPLHLTSSFQKRKSDRRQRNMSMHGWNVVYLILGTFLCLISALDGGFCLRCTLMIICSALLILEIRQQGILVFNPAAEGTVSVKKFCKKVRQKRYWKDPENYLELIFLISVPVSIIHEGWEQKQPRTEPERSSGEWDGNTLCRGFIAMGVFSAWIELVIKMGNISLSIVGDFIKMFYNIIRYKLVSYMKVCFLLITAFSLSFWIILEGQLDTRGPNFLTGFWFSQILSTTMSIGEFNTIHFYESIGGNGFSKVFALFFLILLICLSTITMVNLLVAAIISDYNSMKEEVYEENLYFIAEYIIEAEKYQRRAEKYLPATIFNFIYPNEKTKREDFKITEDYCPHLICNDCRMEPLPIPRPGTARINPAKEANQRRPLLGRLLEICGTNENLCTYHLKKWGREMQEVMHT